MDFHHLRGLTYLPGFLAEDRAEAMRHALDEGQWDTTLKRRVRHFGYRYDYRARTVTGDAYLGPLPEWLQGLCERLVAERFFARIPDQVIANEYMPGQGISAHVDCEPCFGETIASLSLLSACEMVFRQRAAQKMQSLILEPGSLLVLSGPARYDWTHEIAARASDLIDGVRRPRGRRVSLTFRNVVRAG